MITIEKLAGRVAGDPYATYQWQDQDTKISLTSLKACRMLAGIMEL